MNTAQKSAWSEFSLSDDGRPLETAVCPFCQHKNVGQWGTEADDWVYLVDVCNHFRLFVAGGRGLVVAHFEGLVAELV